MDKIFGKQKTKKKTDTGEEIVYRSYKDGLHFKGNVYCKRKAKVYPIFWMSLDIEVRP